ncbi:MAG: M13 family metallopeptidase [Idiomarina sp.]
MKKITTVALSVALALGVAACSPQQNNETKQNSAEQVAQAELQSGVYLDSFDQSVRAQDDLFQYVNGTWYKNTEIPGDRSSIGAFYELREQNQERLRTIIETAAESNPEAGTNAAKIGDFFNSFMNVELLNELSYTPIQADLAEIAALDDHASVAAHMAELSRLGVSIPFGFYVYPDAKDPNVNTMYFTQSGLGLPDREYYLKDDEKFQTYRDEYQSYLTDLLTMLEYSNPAAAAEAVMEFETELAEVQWSRVDSRDADKTYNKYSKDELNELFDDFNYGAYAQAAGLDGVDSAVVRQPSYFEALDDLLSETDTNVLKHYMTVRLADRFAPALAEAFGERRFEFYGKVLQGNEVQEPRWKRGVDATDSALGEVLGQLYVAEYFPAEAKERMSALVDNLTKAYAESIESLEWMTADTKEKALEKLSKFDPKIGYPNEWRDYTGLAVSAEDLVGNYKRSAAFNYDEEIAKIGEPVKDEDWGMTPQTVNAYYSPVRNEIVFPAGILQPPFFNMEAEDAVNYGGIGAVIGHEIGHGFDDQGSKYDGDGNLRSWWTDTDRAAFEERATILADQYSGYEVLEDVFINGRLALGENIGDLAGLTIAYKAYQMSLNGEESPEMDGFTGEQRVFIGWAQVWKNKAREEALRQHVMRGPHSPAMFRVNGTVVNIPGFYEAFDVKPGDDLYVAPENRVTIW